MRSRFRSRDDLEFNSRRFRIEYDPRNENVWRFVFWRLFDQGAKIQRKKMPQSIPKFWTHISIYYQLFELTLNCFIRIKHMGNKQRAEQSRNFFVIFFINRPLSCMANGFLSFHCFLFLSLYFHEKCMCACVQLLSVCCLITCSAHELTFWVLTRVSGPIALTIVIFVYHISIYISHTDRLWTFVFIWDNSDKIINRHSLTHIRFKIMSTVCVCIFRLLFNWFLSCSNSFAIP